MNGKFLSFKSFQLLNFDFAQQACIAGQIAGRKIGYHLLLFVHSLDDTIRASRCNLDLPLIRLGAASV